MTKYYFDIYLNYNQEKSQSKKKEVYVMEFKLKEFISDVNVTRMANIHYFEFIKEYHTTKDKHPFRELIYVDSGTITVEADDYCGPLYSKQILIHKANEAHSLSCADGSAPNVIIIGFECNSEMLDLFSKKPTILSNEQTKILTDVIREGRSVYLPPYDEPNIKDMKKRDAFLFGADQMLKLKLEIFLIELIRSVNTSESEPFPAANDAKISEIYSYVSNNYSEKITLNDLCFLFCTNKTTICKSFKNTYGDTLINHINKLRIKHAKNLMREGNLNLTQISEKVGFSSIHYFNKIFKSLENKSPSEYIKTIKSKLNI